MKWAYSAWQKEWRMQLKVYIKRCKDFVVLGGVSVGGCLVNCVYLFASFLLSHLWNWVYLHVWNLFIEMNYCLTNYLNIYLKLQTPK